ncbi:MAG: hypothetical protein HYR72_03980 [Deltaproteobacteria bacterium]|nr:hypothetical protein [Deltaproteobacteria bacterium]MBI3388653.1 hypothetical protein [Deltaproteobacteria bacterium]
MAIATGLSGIFSLTRSEIDANVSRSIGAYLLGDVLLPDNSLTIRYAGRSDDDLNGRLKDWIGKYRYFMYGHFPNATAAYEKECLLYHAFGGAQGRLDNEIHPAKPYAWNHCPACGA